MTAHKHAEMIKAKADNMELVVFVRPNHSDGWYKMQDDIDIPEFFSTDEYFLCHPKHEKECLHWLNGGKVDIHEGESEKIKWTPINLGVVWGEYHPFMNSSLIFRIKPRKEKRWIGVTKSGESTMHYKNKRTLIENIERMGPLLDNYQLIEIEVEV